MSPEELRAAVRERLASRWPGVVVTFGESSPTLEVHANIMIHVGCAAHPSADRDEIDAMMIADMLDMGLRTEVSRRGLYAATQEAAEAKKA